MSLITNLFSRMDGMAIFNIVGLIIFVVFFIGILLKIYKMPKSEAEKIKKSIFDN